MKDEIEVSKVLIQDDRGRFLVLQKSDSYGWMGGKWEFPGGKLEEDEDRFDAARREILSETSLEIEELEDVVRVEVEENQSKKPVVDCWILHTPVFEGELKLSPEHQDHSWVTSEEFFQLDWHRDAGYAIPALQHLKQYIRE